MKEQIIQKNARLIFVVMLLICGGHSIGYAHNTGTLHFDDASTTRSVAENTGTGQNIGTAVTATAASVIDTLTYTLSGTDSASFDIVSTSGQLQTKSTLDYETKNGYSVTVDVSDGTNDASITVTISITDVNEAPTFPATTDTTLEVTKHIAVGANIGAPVAATDPDTADGDTDVNPTDDGVDALTAYSLGGTDAASFDFDTSTGQLTAKDGVAFDRKTKSSYAVTVSVSDGEFTGSRPRSLSLLS